MHSPQGSETAFEAFLSVPQSLLDAVPTGLCICSNEGALLRYNERAVELWGRRPPLRDPGVHHGDEFRRFKPDGSPLPYAATPVARALRTGERVNGAELVIERPGGSRVSVLMNVALLAGASGKAQGAVCSFQELTGRKRTEELLRASEAELQSVINRTPFMLVRCSRDLRYRFASQGYARLLGRRREDIVGKTITEVVGEAGFDAVRPHIHTVLQGGSVEFDSEIDFPGVGKRILNIIYQPELDATGKVDGWIASVRDITTETRADQAGRQLASIVESSSDAIISKDLNGIIVSWNPAAQALFGYTSEEAVGKSVTILIPPELLDEEPKILERIRRGERVEHYETVRRGKDGSPLDISLTISPVKNRHGKIIGASKIARDIGARKRAERALAERAEEQAVLYRFTDRLYRAAGVGDIYDAAMDAIVGALHCRRVSILRCDDGGKMRFVAWRGLSDGHRNAADGHSPWAADGTSPDVVCINDIDRADLPTALKAQIKQEGIRALAFVPVMANGRLAGEFMIYYDAPHAFERREIDLALTIARQLGFGVERLQAEQARDLMDAELRSVREKLEVEVERRTQERDRIWNVSEDLLAVSNFEGYFLSLNPAWTRLLGWTEDEIKSMHVVELRHPDDNAHSTAAREQLVRGASTVRMENRLRHKDGSWRWLQWTMTENRGLIYVAGRHVTVEKEAAAALEYAQRQAAHLQKMEAIGQLTGGVAHDFNNLLMIVSGQAQNLSQRLTAARDVRALHAIQMAATRGENLTRQLLSFARTLPLDPTVFRPAEAIGAVRDVLAGSLHVNIELHVDVPDTIWPVRVDKSELELALLNLAVNARDAMAGGGRLSIAAANAQMKAEDNLEGISGDVVALTVSDTGTGIAPDLLSRVVEPFFTTKGPDKGTGLGLSQVYGFACRSGGTMAIDSEVGRGTEVTIFLPRSGAAVSAPLPEDTVPYSAMERRTILVVEDNPHVREVAVSLLEQLGYRTKAVENAADALEVLAAGENVSLVFSDVVLPGRLDGLALARALNDRHPGLPIVLTTGYAKVFDIEPGFPVLRKPYRISALGRVIYDALNAPPANRRAAAH